jgi:iron-sulfur cluster assembly accessory protein
MADEVTITDRAANKIRKLLGEAKERQGLRVRIVEGGCSGFEYQLEIDFPDAKDQVFEKDGARILLGADSLQQVKGSELDYKDTLMQSGFVFNNPNVKSTCGCGVSFSA